MLGEFLLRIAIALPLVCALAAICLLAIKRGWLRLPVGAVRFGAPGGAGLAGPFELVAVRSLSPTSRIALVRFGGADLLIGVSGQSIRLLAQAPTGAPGAPGES